MNNHFERVNDIAVVELNTAGFDGLSEQQKKLAYHLSQAGLWGRYIALDQDSEHNIPLFTALIEVYNSTEEGSDLHTQVKDTLFVLFAHNGLYHSTTGHILPLPLNKDVLETYRATNSEIVDTISHIVFGDLPTYRTVQADVDENGNAVDVVAVSGANFYKGLSIDEVKAYREDNYPKHSDDEVPPYGFNERLVKTENGIERQIICENGLYGAQVKNIIHHLTNALEFAENEAQHESIRTLIECYRTGNAKDFDTHCVAWTKDTESDVYFINGLIESYKDPLGIGCNFESIVAFKNPLQTAKVNKIIENIQWFEDNLPFDKQFKKDKAQGLSASSITVVSMAGDTSPSLPLGINLPNSDWIRAKHGSKSVNLDNVATSRSTSEGVLRNELYLPKYQEIIERYGNMAASLHTDLHEIAGHGSGKVLEGRNTDDIGAYYSTIEECRADLVALYYVANPKLKEFGVFDADVVVEDAARAEYVSYLTNGAFGQLRRIDLGKDLTQAHFRNRQLISNWVLEHADKDKVAMIEQDGKTYIEVNDLAHAQELFGKLLAKIQEIKSTADFEGARDLVLTYGTKVDQSLHARFLERINKLDLARVLCFNTPMLVEKDNTIVIEQPSSFFEQQMQLHSALVASPNVSKKMSV